MSVRSRLPEPGRTLVRNTYVRAGTLTAPLRLTPDMIVIGGQRCGTTSLFRALEQHPQMIRPTFNKGINYFDINYHRGPRWYAGHFPLVWRADLAARFKPSVAFEASGYYLFHPLAPERIARDLPEVKVVAMLRDPVERAYSAWKHESARGYESESFERALQLEEGRTDGEVERMRRDPRYQSRMLRHHAYAARSEYADLLARYYDRFSADQIHVMYSEEFFADPEGEFRRLEGFLGITHHRGIVFDQHNARQGGAIPPGPCRDLRERFEPQTHTLHQLVGRRPPWPSQALEAQT